MTTQTAPTAGVERLEYIQLDQVRTDGGTQARAGLNEETVAEYAATWQDLAYLQNGLDRMPPIVLYHDGESYWLADGFHRVEAYKRFLGAGSASASPRALRADVRQGTRRDAVLHACGANAAHGLRRTNADKRRAVETLLRDEEWQQWSDRKIAEACAVSDKTVAAARLDLSAEIPQIATRTVDRGGTTYQMTPPSRPTRPNAPAGWVWRNDESLRRLADGEITRRWPNPTDAVAEAEQLDRDRPVRGRRQPPPIVTGADEPSDEEFNETVRAFAQHGHRLIRSGERGDRYALFPPEGVGIANMQWHAVAARLGVLERQAYTVGQRVNPNKPDPSEPPPATGPETPESCDADGPWFWASMSAVHPTAHCWHISRLTSKWVSACGLERPTQPTHGAKGFHCGVCEVHAERREIVPIPAPAQQIPSDIAKRAAQLELLIDAVEAGLILYWPEEHGQIGTDRGDSIEPMTPGEAREWLTTQGPEMALERLDRLMPKDLFQVGYYWHSADPPTIAHNDGWRGDAPTAASALELARARFKAVAPAARPTPIGDWWNPGASIDAINAAIGRGDRARAVQAALALANQLAGDDLTALAEELDDASYEALAAYRRDRSVPTLESEGIV